MTVSLRQIEWTHLVLSGTLAAVAAWGNGWQMGLSIAIGGALMAGNVWLFRQLFAFLVRKRPARHRLAIALLFAKLPLLWGLLWLAGRAPIVALDGVGLAAGITCFPIAVVVVALARHTRRAEVQS
jgi:hypothetical protein